MSSQGLLSTLSPIKRVPAGKGRITLALHGTKAVFEELSSAYPLKLLSPRVQEVGVAIVYLLSYGGGLVGGDRVELDVQLKEGSTLVVLSQGSTKVFKTRPGSRLASIQQTTNTNPDLLTSQTIHYTLASKSCLFLLPDPVTCFRSASYNQIQTFRIAGDASILVLDWLTSGRKALDEDWVFTRYYSENEIFVEGRRVVKDVMLLQADEDVKKGGETTSSLRHLPRRTLGDRLAPYSCYAMVLLYGLELKGIIGQLAERFGGITVFKQKTPDDLLWSFSPISTAGAGAGAVLRVAGKETELVRKWLQEALKGVEDVVGADVYRRAFV